MVTVIGLSLFCLQNTLTAPLPTKLPKMVQMVYSHIHGLRLETPSLMMDCSSSGPDIDFLYLKRSEMKVVQSCLTVTPWTVASQVPLSMGFPRQEYWSGLPFPSPGDLPDPRIEQGSPALQANSLPTEISGKP